MLLSSQETNGKGSSEINGNMQNDHHKRLGLLWFSTLSFTKHLEQRVKIASGKVVASLAGLVSSEAVPLARGIELFNAKVDGCMRLVGSSS